MPTYEFRCPDGSVIERSFKMSEVPDEIPLPDGSGVATRMISGGAGLLFKGTGFYITDYGKDGKKDQRDASAASSSATGDAKKAESKADAKPAESRSESKPAESKPAPAPASPSPSPKSE